MIEKCEVYVVVYDVFLYIFDKFQHESRIRKSIVIENSVSGEHRNR